MFQNGETKLTISLCCLKRRKKSTFKWLSDHETNCDKVSLESSTNPVDLVKTSDVKVRGEEDEKKGKLVFGSQHLEDVCCNNNLKKMNDEFITIDDTGEEHNCVNDAPDKDLIEMDSYVHIIRFNL